jgi:hypothetical protein
MASDFTSSLTLKTHVAQTERNLIDRLQQLADLKEVPDDAAVENATVLAASMDQRATTVANYYADIKTIVDGEVKIGNTIMNYQMGMVNQAVSLDIAANGRAKTLIGYGNRMVRDGMQMRGVAEASGFFTNATTSRLSGMGLM